MSWKGVSAIVGCFGVLSPRLPLFEFLALALQAAHSVNHGWILMVGRILLILKMAMEFEGNGITAIATFTKTKAEVRVGLG